MLHASPATSWRLRCGAEGATSWSAPCAQMGSGPWRGAAQMLGIGLSLSFRPGAQSPSVCTKRIDSLTSPFHSPSLPLPIQSHPEALPHHHLTPTTPAPVRGPDSPSPPAVCNTVAASRLVSSRHPSLSLRPIGLDCGPPYATYRRHGIAKGARRAQAGRRLSPHI
jgi:hypothetical protein